MSSLTQLTNVNPVQIIAQPAAVLPHARLVIQHSPWQVENVRVNQAKR